MDKKIKVSTRSIQPVVKISTLDNQENDFQYWQSRPFSDRLAALEEIRTKYHKKENIQTGIQKVVSIIKQ